MKICLALLKVSSPLSFALSRLTNNILSTAQQIWLQKLGGAKNPVKQFSDRAAKEESFNMQSSLSEIQKSVQDLEIDKSKDSQREKVNSGGLQPGERYV